MTTSLGTAAVIRAEVTRKVYGIAAPPGQPAIFMVARALTGALAGLPPARQAARPDMLTAIAAP
jgi:hypothetical protein